VIFSITSLTVKLGALCGSGNYSGLRHQCFDDLVDAEARRPRTRRELLEALQPLRQQRWRRVLQENLLAEPVVVLEAFLAVLERIGAQVEGPRNAQGRQGSRQTSRPVFRCSAKTNLNLPMRIAMHSPSSLQ